MTVASKPREPRQPRPTSKQRLRLWMRLLRASRAIEAELRERLRVQFAITLPQFDVMAALARQDDGINMTELSRMLMVSNGNVTGIVDRLVADRLVLRQAPRASDRRSFIVRLTPKGAGAIRRRRQARTRAGSTSCWAEFDGAEAEAIIEQLTGSATRIRNGGRSHEHDRFQAAAFHLARRGQGRGHHASTGPSARTR